jgi:hypothetical protein
MASVHIDQFDTDGVAVQSWENGKRYTLRVAGVTFFMDPKEFEIAKATLLRELKHTPKAVK